MLISGKRVGGGNGSAKFLLSFPCGSSSVSDVPMRLTSSPVPLTPPNLHLRNIGMQLLQLLQNDSLGVGSTTELGALVGGTEGTLAVLLVGPALSTTIGLELASSVETTGLVVT